MDPLPPSVRLLGHFAEVGLILEWRQKPDRTWEALVDFAVVVPGYRGGLERDQQWFPQERVQPIDGENYSRVPKTKARPTNP